MKGSIWKAGHAPKDAIIKLNGLTALNQHKIMGSVIYGASKPMEEEQRRVLRMETYDKEPKTWDRQPGQPTGNLLKSIGRVRVPIRKAKEIGTVQIGPRINRGYKGKHAHLLEFGHKKVLWGKQTGERVKAFPFVEPAYRSKMGQVRNNMYRELHRIIKRWTKSGRVTTSEFSI